MWECFSRYSLSLSLFLFLNLFQKDWEGRLALVDLWREMEGETRRDGGTYAGERSMLSGWLWWTMDKLMLIADTRQSTVSALHCLTCAMLSALAVPRRSFVSTVLLSRTWENETVLELRKEARVRGLSTYVSTSPFSRPDDDHSRGNKSTLIARIQEHEENGAAPSPPPRTSRNASTNPVPPKATSQAASPGIPLAAQPGRLSSNSDFSAIKLPNLSRPPPNVPVQVVRVLFHPCGVASLMSSIPPSNSMFHSSPMCPTSGIPPVQIPTCLLNPSSQSCMSSAAQSLIMMEGQCIISKSIKKTAPHP